MRKSKQLKAEQKKILRDAGVFAVKLWLDGIKDILFSVLALFAALIDVLRGPQKEGYLFYKVMATGKRVDDVINLYHAKAPDSLLEHRDPLDRI